MLSSSMLIKQASGRLRLRLVPAIQIPCCSQQLATGSRHKSTIMPQRSAMSYDPASSSPPPLRLETGPLSQHLLLEHHHQQQINRLGSKPSAMITSMNELVKKIPNAVQQRKVNNVPPGSPNDPVLQLFRKIQFRDSSEWSRYAFVCGERPYTRNLIATDHETYTLLLLCWKSQCESPIHDHPCDGCWFQVLQGSIQECRYDNALECISDQSFVQGQTAYITDQMGYHKIGNLGQELGVSLHLYAPPIQQCQVFSWGDDENVPCQKTAEVTHDSEYGFRL